MAESEPGNLTQNQAQGLSVALRRLERILFSVEELSNGTRETLEGAMVSLTNPLTFEQQAQLVNLVEQARASIATLANRFDLKPEKADLAREAHGRLVEMWSALEDTKSNKLRRYGRVDPALSTSLDPEIDNLIQVVLAMDKELFTRGPGAETRNDR